MDYLFFYFSFFLNIENTLESIYKAVLVVYAVGPSLWGNHLESKFWCFGIKLVLNGLKMDISFFHILCGAHSDDDFHCYF